MFFLFIVLRILCFLQRVFHSWAVCLFPRSHVINLSFQYQLASLEEQITLTNITTLQVRHAAQ